MADVEFQYSDANSPVVRERFNFGQFPIMLKAGVMCFLFLKFIMYCVLIVFV